MTRVNLTSIEDLHELHLKSEHREIKRIPNHIKKGQIKPNGIPDEFKLNEGHLKFFYYKQKFLHKRYNALYRECRKRGINVTDFSGAFEGIPDELYNDWTPSSQDIQISQERINDRLLNLK